MHRPQAGSCAHLLSSLSWPSRGFQSHEKNLRDSLLKTPRGVAVGRTGRVRPHRDREAGHTCRLGSSGVSAWPPGAFTSTLRPLMVLQMAAGREASVP